MCSGGWLVEECMQKVLGKIYSAPGDLDARTWLAGLMMPGLQAIQAHLLLPSSRNQSENVLALRAAVNTALLQLHLLQAHINLSRAQHSSHEGNKPGSSRSLILLKKALANYLKDEKHVPINKLGVAQWLLSADASNALFLTGAADESTGLAVETKAMALRCLLTQSPQSTNNDDDKQSTDAEADALVSRMITSQQQTTPLNQSGEQGATRELLALALAYHLQRRSGSLWLDNLSSMAPMLLEVLSRQGQLTNPNRHDDQHSDGISYAGQVVQKGLLDGGLRAALEALLQASKSSSARYSFVLWKCLYACILPEDHHGSHPEHLPGPFVREDGFWAGAFVHLTLSLSHQHPQSQAEEHENVNHVRGVLPSVVHRMSSIMASRPNAHDLLKQASQWALECGHAKHAVTFLRTIPGGVGEALAIDILLHSHAPAKKANGAAAADDDDDERTTVSIGLSDNLGVAWTMCQEAQRNALWTHLAFALLAKLNDKKVSTDDEGKDRFQAKQEDNVAIVVKMALMAVQALSKARFSKSTATTTSSTSKQQQVGTVLDALLPLLQPAFLSSIVKDAILPSPVAKDGIKIGTERRATTAKDDYSLFIKVLLDYLSNSPVDESSLCGAWMIAVHFIQSLLHQDEIAVGDDLGEGGEFAGFVSQWNRQHVIHPSNRNSDALFRAQLLALVDKLFLLKSSRRKQTNGTNHDDGDVGTAVQGWFGEAGVALLLACHQHERACEVAVELKKWPLALHAARQANSLAKNGGHLVKNDSHLAKNDNHPVRKVVHECWMFVFDALILDTQQHRNQAAPSYTAAWLQEAASALLFNRIAHHRHHHLYQQSASSSNSGHGDSGFAGLLKHVLDGYGSVGGGHGSAPAIAFLEGLLDQSDGKQAISKKTKNNDNDDDLFNGAEEERAILTTALVIQYAKAIERRTNAPHQQGTSAPHQQINRFSSLFANFSLPINSCFLLGFHFV